MGAMHRLAGFFSLTRLAGCATSACLAVLVGCAGKSAPTTTGKKGDMVVPVVAATASRKTVPVEIEIIGNVEAYSTIGIKAQVGGELVTVHFQEGDYVKKGDLLFSIDRRPFDAMVSQAKANLARDTAQLSQARANLARDIASQKFATAQAARFQNLHKQGIISAEQSEQYTADADAKVQAVQADQAAIQSSQAAIEADKATLENTQIQLGYTTIRSPIDGRTGNLMVKQGNVVKANDIDLVTINQLSPIYATFSVPEAELPDIKRYMAQGKVKVIATPEKDASGGFEQGVLTFVDNAVDMTTGTIRLKGTFTNQDRKLWPGQFVRVVVKLTERPDTLVVPTQALQTGQDGQFVFVVKQNMTVESRPVTVGPRVDQEVVIEKGLEPGEQVVTEGQLRLVPGSRVRIGGGPGGGPRGGRKKA
jgi:membrane fusion protein, multidrug efflux system